jgi:flagellar biosynthesis/type III secretory pathway protein FliH
MGGKVLEYEAKTILNQGISLGFTRGRSEGRNEGLREGRDEGLRLGRDEGLRLGRDEGINEERASGIHILIQTYKELNQSLTDAVQGVAKKYDLSIEEAQEIVKKDW